jgi:DNA invertase Pin-like site-specific DNA recombinase
MDLTNRIASQDPCFVVRGYGRASTEKQIMSPLQQESACQDAFNLYKRVKSGWANAEWGGFFFDEATTRTSKFRERAVGSLVLATTKPGDVILVSNFDRIFAKVVDVCETLELVEQRKFRLTILDMDIDIGCDLGKMVFQILAAVKELDVKTIRRRARENAAYRVANGLPHGGPAPVGWKVTNFKSEGRIKKRLVPQHEHRALAKVILDLRVGKELSYQELTDELIRRRIPNPGRDGKNWSKMSVRRWANAALLNFPLRNGSHTPAPIPPDAEPVEMDTILADN